MQFIGLRIFISYSFFFILVSASAHVNYQRQPYQARDIFSPIESLADSILGITTTQSSAQAAALTSTTLQATTTQDGSTPTATTQVVTVVPTAAATTQTSASETSSGAISVSTATLTVPSIASSSALATTDHYASQTLSSSLSLTSSTLPSNANPIQSLPSSSAGGLQVKQNNSNSVPAAGVAVATVFGVLIIAAIAYLSLKHLRNARGKAANLKSSGYHETKRSSYFDHDAEQGTVYNPGLGLGEVAELRTAPRITTPSRARACRTWSRDRSEDTLIPETTLSMLAHDRRESPLPPRPNTLQESWPIISPVDTPPPQSLMVTLPAATASSGNPVAGYIPYRREVEPIIGLAVPLSSSHAHTAQSLGPQRSISLQTHGVAASERARRVSGVHELS
jgi:hypothetical protein